MLKIYTVKLNYLNYLFEYDNRVPLEHKDAKSRPYVGTVLTIDILTRCTLVTLVVSQACIFFVYNVCTYVKVNIWMTQLKCLLEYNAYVKMKLQVF